MSGEQTKLEGWLWKKGEGFVGAKRWKKRWFVVSNDQLCYYEKKTDEKSLGTIDLISSKKVVWREPFDNFGYERKDDQWGFQINTPDRSWCFLAPTYDDLEFWKKGLSKYITDSDATRSSLNDNQAPLESSELSDEEKVQLKRLFQHPFQMKACGFVRLFEYVRLSKTDQPSWKEKEIIGALVLVYQSQTRQYSFRVLNPETSAVSWVFKLDQVENLYYEEETDYFHSFNGDKDDISDIIEETRKATLNESSEENSTANSSDDDVEYRMGLSFSSVSEAKQFYEKIMIAIQEYYDALENSKNAPVESPNVPPTTTTAETTTPAANPTSNTNGASEPLNLRAFTRLWTNFRNNLNNPMNNNNNNNAEDDFKVSEPESFRHAGHVGWSLDGGFETRLPSEWLEKNPTWKNFFLQIGVNADELKDEKMTQELIEETTQFIMNLQAPPPAPPSKETTGEMRTKLRETMKMNKDVVQSMLKEEERKDAENSSNAPPPPPAPPAEGPSTAKPFTRALPATLPQLKPNQEEDLRGHLTKFLVNRRHHLKEDVANEEDDD